MHSLISHNFLSFFWFFLYLHTSNTQHIQLLIIIVHIIIYAHTSNKMCTMGGGGGLVFMKTIYLNFNLEVMMGKQRNVLTNMKFHNACK